MEEPKRRFRSDIVTKNIDALLEKRQRKRFSKSKNSPYDRHNNSIDLTSAPSSNKTGQQVTEIKGIPREMLPVNKKLLNESIRREYDKPEHWIAPKREVKRSREEVRQAEKANITKSINERAVRSYAAELLLKASQQGRKASSSFLTAKGYISRRLDNSE